MDNKNKSFRLSSFQPTDTTKKWWQLRKMDKREFGYTALICILSGALGGLIRDILVPIGWICAIVWLYLLIKEKWFKKTNE